MTYTWNIGGTISTTYANSTTSQALGASTTYTVQLTNAYGCVGAVPAPAAITVNPIPNISLNSGSANQTATQNTPITPIIYTASNSAVISGSGFPTGVSGNPSGSSYTISGTPTVLGTFGYSLTASANGCTSSAAVGTITVAAAFYSPSTWIFGDYTWSDRVVSKPSGCDQVTTLSTTDSASPPTQYKIYIDNGVERYYYNWSCALTICPSGWSLPTQDHVRALVNATDKSYLYGEWGYGGCARGSSMEQENTHARYWTSTAFTIDSYYAYELDNYSVQVSADHYGPKTIGYQVRCIK
jgi:hypothetical protein